MTDYIPDLIEQRARIQEIQSTIFDDPYVELLAASDTPTIQRIKGEESARAEVHRRLDELEGLALAGELSAAEVGQLRRLQARARLAGLRRRYI